MMEILTRAKERKQKALSEFDSKELIRLSGVATVREKLARSREEALQFASELGYPVVFKGCSDRLLHKTEKGMVKLNLKNADEAGAAYDDITVPRRHRSRRRPGAGDDQGRQGICHGPHARSPVRPLRDVRSRRNFHGSTERHFLQDCARLPPLTPGRCSMKFARRISWMSSGEALLSTETPS